MIECPNCKTQNPEADTYCYACGYALDEGSTNRLNAETGPVAPRRRWGTARFDTHTILVLTARDYDAPSIYVTLDRDTILGRSHEDYMPDVDLSGFEAYERGVSRQHAVLRRQDDTVLLIDLNSANSTFLNGQRLVPEQPRIIRDGDEIRLGQLVLRANFEDVINE